MPDNNEFENKMAKQRADFVSALKHRMRTPVSAAVRISQLFLEDEFGPLTSQQRQVVMAFHEDQRNLLDLIDVMKDIYSYQNNTKMLNSAPVTVSLLFSELEAAFSPRIIKGVRLSSSIAGADDLSFDADRAEIRKLLWHLLDNAFKHCRSIVKLGATSVDNNLVEIRVEDDGCGICAPDLVGLFDRFYDVSSDGKYAPATGTGLCLCAQIAKAHGGTIECQSTPGKGSVFRLVVPMHRAAKV
ncbi:MAG: HAMP domain-containing histidine kinase [Candidatus Obscuribacterales bacterium]|nr:HAMP domain-containing histidine kinase [Candidatus Obscuribacterales bacterium]